MTCVNKLPALLWAVLVVSLSAAGSVAETAANPYLGIVQSNPFRLKPPQRQEADTPPVPLPRVKLVGITTFGDKYALLKINQPAMPPAPARELSCVLTVGQREGPVEVLEVDESSGKVKVRNSGTIMLLTLEYEKPAPPSPIQPSALASPPILPMQPR
jgi:hypothetical protein